MNQGPSPDIDRIGIIVIGRNEAPRLGDCLRSLDACRCARVYVDSGSTDGSPDIAERLGVRVVRLTSGPYCASRAREAGLAALAASNPPLEFVQFVDGDCVMQPGWIDAAIAVLRQDRRCAAVCGMLRERHRDKSLLIRLVDIEWREPAGEIDAIGGVFLGRLSAIRDAGGWSTVLAAGEDMDLAARLRARGWKLIRLPQEMALHDMGIRTLGEYWRRSVRTGVAHADLALRHGRGQYRHWNRRPASHLLHGVVLPLALAAACVWYPPSALLFAAVYLLWLARVARWQIRSGQPAKLSFLYACLLLLGKVASGLGVVKLLLHAAARRHVGLMEYKAPALAERTQVP